MTDKSDKSNKIEFLEDEFHRAAIAFQAAEAALNASAARLQAAYDGVTKRRNEALEKRREDMRNVGFKPEFI